jgi:hypothetical protein
MRVVYQRFGGLSPTLMNRAPRYEVELPAPDAITARRLIPPEFFSLESTPDRNRRPDMFLHEIAVEDGSRSHRVVLSDEDISPTLRPFVEWLQQRAGVS